MTIIQTASDISQAKTGSAATPAAADVCPLDDYPYLAEIATKLPDSGYDPAVEFAWGLDLILDGLDQLRRGA